MPGWTVHQSYLGVRECTEAARARMAARRRGQVGMAATMAVDSACARVRSERPEAQRTVQRVVRAALARRHSGVLRRQTGACAGPPGSVQTRRRERLGSSHRHTAQESYAREAARRVAGAAAVERARPRAGTPRTLASWKLRWHRNLSVGAARVCLPALAPSLRTPSHPRMGRSPASQPASPLRVALGASRRREGLRARGRADSG